MKNWNDAGTVHYNAETNQRYCERQIRFSYRLVMREFNLAIPMTMIDALKQEHFDQAIIVAKRTIDRVALMMMKGGDFRHDHITDCCNRLAFVAMCEHLYNEFHLHQHKVGDAVWATPERMQDVGQRPEEDSKYLN